MGEDVVMGKERRLAAATVLVAVVALLAAGCTSAGTTASSPVGTPTTRSVTPSSAVPTTTAPTTTAPTTTAPTSPPGPVPAQYAGMVAQLTTQLDGYQAAVDAMPDYRSSSSSTPAFVPAAELLDANGNRQTALLQPGALGLVEQELDAFSHLGVTGVTIGIKLPLLLSQFTPQAARYADFYAAVADQARQRGFTIDVELGGLFCGTTFSACSFAYPSTVSGWAQLTADQARIVIDRVHPTYLDIMSEPNTEANLTSIHALETVTGVTQFVTDTLGLIGPHGSTKIGAGAASWFPISFDQAIATTGVDVLMEHIYPLTPGIVSTLTATAALAHQVGKPLVADEVWLYKGSTTASGNVTASGQESKMAAYSFFEPLDQRFLAITREWSQKADVAYTSPFWSMQLFSYVTWTPQLEAGTVDGTLALLDQAASSAMAQGRYTATGLAWARPD